MTKRAIERSKVQSAWTESDRRGRQDRVSTMLVELGSVVYAVRTKDNLIKIGCTTNLAERCRKVGLGAKSILAWRAGTLDDEARIHASLAGLAVRGREWYPWDDRVIAVVNEMRRELGIVDDIAA